MDSVLVKIVFLVIISKRRETVVERVITCQVFFFFAYLDPRLCDSVRRYHLYILEGRIYWSPFF